MAEGALVASALRLARMPVCTRSAVPISTVGWAVPIVGSNGELAGLVAALIVAAAVAVAPLLTRPPTADWICVKKLEERIDCAFGIGGVGAVLAREDVVAADLRVEQRADLLERVARLSGDDVDARAAAARDGGEVGRELRGDAGELRHHALRGLHLRGRAVDVGLPGIGRGDLRIEAERDDRVGAEPGIGIGHAPGRGLLRRDVELLLDAAALGDEARRHAEIGDAGDAHAHETVLSSSFHIDCTADSTRALAE